MDSDFERRIANLERNQRAIAAAVIVAVWVAAYEICTRGVGMNPSWAILIGAGGAVITTAWLSARVRGL